MGSTRTRLGLLLQARREASGFSRARLADLVDVPAKTIEGWEVGRVAKPPVHDVLRVARVLRIPVAEIEAAVLDPEESPPRALSSEQLESRGAVPLLEQAIELFGWSEEQAAAALQTSVPRVRAWRRGSRAMTLPEVMTVAALIGLHAVGSGHVGDIGELFPAAAGALAPPDRS